MTISTLPVGPLAANSYLLTLGGDALLIDAGDDYPALERACAGAGHLLGILLTHAHFDHTVSAAHIARRFGCPAYIREDDAVSLKSPDGTMQAEFGCGTPFEPLEALPLPEGEFEIGPFKFEVLAMPGHTPGGSALLFKGEGALFTGDTLFSEGYGRTDFPGGSLHALLNSLRALLSMDGELTIYPGHGASARLGDVARRYGR